MAQATQTIRLRRGTAAQWVAANPVLAAGEPGFEVDTGMLKVGNGKTSWDRLPPFLDRHLSADFWERGTSIAPEASPEAPDNAAAIQAKIDAVARQGGGVVYVPPGLWTSGPLVMRSGVSLRGAGQYASVLRLKDGASSHFVTLADANTEQVGIVDLHLDGNKSSQSAGDVVHLDNAGYDNGRALPSSGDPNHYLTRVLITNARRHGLYTTGEYSASLFDSVQSQLCDGNSFYIASPDNSFVSCVSAKSGLEGFYIAGNSERLVNCKVWLAGRLDASKGVGFRVANVSRIDLIGCEAQDNRKDGFSLTGAAHVHLVGRADRNGLGSDAAGYAGDGIYVENLVNSRIDLVAGDRAAGADGNVSGGTRLMQRWAYNCGPGNAGNIVTVVCTASASGSYGHGSWGSQSQLTVTFQGELVTGQPMVCVVWDGKAWPQDRPAATVVYVVGGTAAPQWLGETDVWDRRDQAGA